MRVVLTAVLAIAGCAADAGGGEPDPATARALAATAGLRWILDHHDSLPDGWSFHVLDHLYRVVTDDQTAAEIRRVVIEDDAAGKYLHLPERLDDPRNMQPAILGRILLELLRRKELGRPYEQQRDDIQEQITAGEAELFSKLSPTRRLIQLYLFEELGIESTITFESSLRDIRAVGERRDPRTLHADRVYMLALTHVVFNRSRYFADYVDPNEIDFVVGQLRRALQHYVESPPDDFFLDIQAESLQCWQLLGLPQDEVAAAYAGLVQRQNSDGTWGAADLDHQRRVHLTYSAALALLKYPREFRRFRTAP